MSDQGKNRDLRSCSPGESVTAPLAGGKEILVSRVRLQFLSRQEIERRIEQVTLEVAGESGGRATEVAVGPPGSTPRWISPSELVDRVRPFLVYN